MPTCSKASTLCSLFWLYLPLAEGRNTVYIMFGSHSSLNTLTCMNIMTLALHMGGENGKKLCNYQAVYLMKHEILCLRKCSCGVHVCVWNGFCGSFDKLTWCIFFTELVGSKACVLLGIFVFLGVQISPHRDQCLTWPSVSGAYSVLDLVHQVQYINSASNGWNLVYSIILFWIVRQFINYLKLIAKTYTFSILGYYCPEGTKEAVLCPVNTARSSPGGANLQDCLPCPTHHWCKPGTDW